jgi:putative intracellular protease/amidase
VHTGVQAETMLRQAGAAVQVSWPLFPHVVRDRELISGQGPTSALGLGAALVSALQGAKH